MIEMGKTYRTRDRHEVRIYAVDGMAGHPVHGAIKRTYGWQNYNWSPEGKPGGFDQEHIDLIEVKPTITRKVWLAHHHGGGSHVLSNRHGYIGLDCIAVTGPHEITFTEGEGLTPKDHSHG